MLSAVWSMPQTRGPTLAPQPPSHTLRCSRDQFLYGGLLVLGCTHASHMASLRACRTVVVSSTRTITLCFTHRVCVHSRNAHSPIRALLEADAEHGGLEAIKRDSVRLYYGAQDKAKMAFTDRFKAWEASGVTVVPVFSQVRALTFRPACATDKHKLSTGHGHSAASARGQGADGKYVQAQFTDEGLQPPAEKTFVVLCGQKGMSEVRPADRRSEPLVEGRLYKASCVLKLDSKDVCCETGCGGGHDRGGHPQGAVPHQLLNGLLFLLPR